MWYPPSWGKWHTPSNVSWVFWIPSSSIVHEVPVTPLTPDLLLSMLRSSPKLHRSVPKTPARLILSNVSLHAHACRSSGCLVPTCSSRCQISLAIIPVQQSAAMFCEESKKINERWSQPVNLQPVPFSWGDGSVQPLPAPSSDLNWGRYTWLKCLECIANMLPPQGLNCFLVLWCFLLHFVLMLLRCPKESLLTGSFVLRNYLCNWGMIVHLGTLGSKRQI